MQAESTAAQFIDFQPTQEAASDILAALVDPDQTLGEIARRFHTSIDALADWLESPPVIHRIEAIERATTRRHRLIAISNQRLALSALISILEGHRDDELNLPVNNQSLKAVAQRDRRRATARLAASQLIRLAGSSGPGGTGVSGGPPVLSAQRPSEHRQPFERTDRSPQAGRPCQSHHTDHQDHQTLSPPNPDSSPAHSPSSSSPPTTDLTTHNIETPPIPPTSTSERGTQPSTGRQAARATQSPLRAPLCDSVFQHAVCEFEAG